MKLITKLKNKYLDSSPILHDKLKLNKVIENMSNEDEYINSVVEQAFTKETKSGTDITFNNTINARMNITTDDEVDGSKKILVCGKNIMKTQKMKKNINGVDITIENNYFEIYGTPNTTFNFSFLAPYPATYIEANSTYTLSIEVIKNNTTNLSSNNRDLLYMQSEKNNWDGFSVYINPNGISIKEAVKAFKIKDKLITNAVHLIQDVFYDLKFKLQLESGDTATDFEPFRGEEYTFADLSDVRSYAGITHIIQEETNCNLTATALTK